MVLPAFAETGGEMAPKEIQGVQNVLLEMGFQACSHLAVLLESGNEERVTVEEGLKLPAVDAKTLRAMDNIDFLSDALAHTGYGLHVLRNSGEEITASDEIFVKARRQLIDDFVNGSRTLKLFAKRTVFGVHEIYKARDRVAFNGMRHSILDLREPTDIQHPMFGPEYAKAVSQRLVVPKP